MKEENHIVEKALQNLNKQILPDSVIVVEKKVVRVKEIDFEYLIKSNITNANANIVLKELIETKSKKPLLLIAEFIYPSIMESFANQGFNVIDSAGNCIINTPAFFLKVKGQKNSPAKESKIRAFQETGLKLIFFFLQNRENVNLPYRTISEQTKISLGSIKKVIEDLTAHNFILVTEHGRFLKNRKHLLDRWITAYNQTLKPKLLLNSFSFLNAEKRNTWKDLVLPENMFWGGEAAANLIDHYLYPGTFEIYTDNSAQLLVKTGFVVPNVTGEIKVYRKFWNMNQENNTVPTLLIYADLAGSGNSRCMEAAQRIYDNEFADFE
ncbi:hypothetical protein FACS189428_3310 [Clostridia bacterium]|nr:hypothetical protein FACS189428_3310 [Clostridia bacterium]